MNTTKTNTTYTTEDVLHIIDHMLGNDELNNARLYAKIMRHLEETTCLDCQHIMPRLLEALEIAQEGIDNA